MWTQAGNPVDNKGKFPCPARGDAMIKKCKIVGDFSCPCDADDTDISECQVEIVTKPQNQRKV